MSNFLRTASVAAVLAATALTAAPAQAQVASSNGNATAQARILRPLTLTHVQDLSLGDILLSGTGPFSATVRMGLDGVLSCPTASVTCSGSPTRAQYNVAGTNRQRVLISVPDVTLTTVDGDSLTLTAIAPAHVDLTNSGSPGTNFWVGGSIDVTDTTPDGVYSGTFDVTVQYQ